MSGRQRIDRVRREYNKWAADQTLEDFALRFTAKSARRWPAARVAQTALGSVSFLALEAIGGSITLNYGSTNALAAILVCAFLIFCTALPICYYAAKYGVDIDLLTRGAGFGYIGSTLTSLVYASFTFIFFAIESVIMAMAMELCLGIPPAAGYLVCALAIIPLVTFGIAAISQFQVWTQAIWLILNIFPLAAIMLHTPHMFNDWAAFTGSSENGRGFNLIGFGAAASVTIALIVQVGEQVDFLRFLPDRTQKPVAWWSALLLSGPGWIVPGTLKLLAGSFLAVYALRVGVSRELAGDPAHMYGAAFLEVVGSPPVALGLMCLLVMVCQIKINITNAYAGSIAWSNFFSRLTHSHPGRVVWLVFNVAVAILVMELGVYRAIEQTLAFYSSVAVAWVGALVGDLVINKPLRLSPPGIEFKRAYLYDVNPVGIGSMALAISVAILAQLGAFGPSLKLFAPFLSLAVSMLCAPLLAWLTGGRFYLARPAVKASSALTMTCCICENRFETEDMASCPAYAGPICSLCCSLDARCHDMCKPHARLHEQVASGLSYALPKRFRRFNLPHVVEFILAFGMCMLLVMLTVGFIGLQIAADHRIDPAVLSSTLWKVFFSLLIVTGIISWLFVLVQMSRRAAQEEMLRQADLLMDEIEAHERTDSALKRAKEVAEAANFAKSRYVVGLSHELRTPLNTIMGYAQLLERDQRLDHKPRQQIAVMRRSANHLAGLIDGLLDISKIEAGKLDLSRDEVATQTFIAQIVDMFAIQAAAKGIEFVSHASPELPAIVAMDEKRLRQIIINLLSNAIKFTRSGSVTLQISYRNEVADFIVEDTGPGIAESDLERIFEPFERLPGAAAEPGTGLGLTICRLLAGVMGGSLQVESKVGSGTKFKLRVFLPRIHNVRQLTAGPLTLSGPVGAGRTILIIDDDAEHCSLMAEALAPLDFIVLSASDAIQGLEMAEAIRPDLFLLDIQLPGLDGWQIAARLRDTGHTSAKIVMVSASAIEEYRKAIASPFHDAFIMKPVSFSKLTDVIVGLLGLRVHEADAPAPAAVEFISAEPPEIPRELIDELILNCEIGYLKGLRRTLAEVAARDPGAVAFTTHMLALVDAVDLRRLMAIAEQLREPAT